MTKNNKSIKFSKKTIIFQVYYALSLELKAYTDNFIVMFRFTFSWGIKTWYEIKAFENIAVTRKAFDLFIHYHIFIYLPVKLKL